MKKTLVSKEQAQPEPEPVRRVQKQFMEEEVFYAAPPQRQPLTEQEFTTLWNRGEASSCWGPRIEEFVRAIERAHGIGGPT